MGAELIGTHEAFRGAKIMKQRKITFRNVGVEQGSRVWRNSETGVEIVCEMGGYTVVIPSDGGERVLFADTLAQAREHAVREAGYVRTARATGQN